MTATSRVILASVMCVAATTAVAQDERFPDGRSGLYVGVFVTDRDTETRFDSNSGLGSNINMENDLGLESSMTVARIGGEFWLKRKHKLDFSLFDLSRSATRQIDETIEFGDETFTVNTTVHSTFDFKIAKADYTFAALRRADSYFGLTGGLYVASFKVGMSEATLGTAESEELTAPLPVIGVRGRHRITDRLSVLGYAQWFELEVGDAGGSLRDYLIGGEYRIGRRFDLGLAFNDVSMTVKAEEDNGLRGALQWDYNGWVLYSKVVFGRAD